MALKTFNVDGDVYDKYSKHCKKNGVSMSKQVENFLRDEIEKLTKSKDSSEKVFIDDSKIRKEMKNFDKSLDHPLRKYF